MPDPSRLVTVPSLDDPSLAPAGLLDPLRPRAGAQPATGRIDWTTEAGPMRERLHAFLVAQGYPTDVVTERARHAAGLGSAQGMAGRDAVRAGAHLRPDRPVPAAQRRERRCRAWSSPAPGTVPGVGVPMVLISGKLAADRVDGVPARSAVRRVRPRWLTRPVDAQLRAGYRACARLTWRHGTTYFWGAALLPRRRRRHVYAVYALCRLADDIVDEPETDRQREGRTRRRARPNAARRRFARRLPRPRWPAGSASRSGAGGRGRHRPPLRDRPGVLRPVLRRDGDGPDHHHATRPGTTSAATWRARRRSSAR